ncbi:protein disulfide isomerase [Anaeramoeba ignava]|uniref:Protein disulfide isomerase n=1 Tax=Anaeramoeba ignava TaxID=1746090 RepID=A0A9Q0LA58_ANAIG|nr:protein disulfide isomerase [Anaeramoeba ignava]
MKFLNFLIFFLFFSSNFTFILHLNEEAFENSLKQFDYWIIKFTDNQPESHTSREVLFTKFVYKFKTSFHSGIVNCNKEINLCKKFGIQEYPTFKLFAKQEFKADLTFDKNYTVDDIRNLLNNDLDIAKNITSLKEIKESEDPQIILLIQSTNGHENEIVSNYLNVALKLFPFRNFYLFKFDNENELSETGFPKFVVEEAKHFHGALLNFNSGKFASLKVLPRDENLFYEFVKKTFEFVFQELTPKIYEKLVSEERNIAVLVVDTSNEDTHLFKNSFEFYAHSKIGDFNFTWIDFENLSKIPKKISVQKNQLPRVVAIISSEDKLYIQPREIGIARFINAILENKLDDAINQAKKQLDLQRNPSKNENVKPDSQSFWNNEIWNTKNTLIALISLIVIIGSGCLGYKLYPVEKEKKEKKEK